MNYTIVEFSPFHYGHSCGYCKSENGSKSDGMWTHSLTVHDYQALIDRGWRRSGNYCYKPRMDVTCCPAYTIRCEALNLSLSKSQKKILKRMRKFLTDGKKESTEVEKEGETESAALDVGFNDVGCKEFVRIDNISEQASDIKLQQIDLSLLANMEREDENMEDTNNVTGVCTSSTMSENVEDSASASTALPMNQKKKSVTPALGMDSSRPPMKKGRLMRLKRREEKAKLKNINLPDLVKAQNQSKTIEDFIDTPLPEESKHELVLRLVNLTVDSPETKAMISLEHKLYQKYQMSVHGDSAEKCSLNQFSRFLVQSPIQSLKTPDGPTIGYGSFHQQYWLDGELMGVAVLDVLPKCVSSVYFFYDPNYAFLSLGTYSSLREAAMTRELNQESKSLKYYYMGYYIHSCPKMRYKAKMAPSFLLCPQVYSWHSFETSWPKFETNPYSRLNDNSAAIDEDSNVEINLVLILWKHMPCQYKKFKRLCKKDIKTDEIKLYGQLVGRILASRMLFYHS